MAGVKPDSAQKPLAKLPATGSSTHPQPTIFQVRRHSLISQDKAQRRYALDNTLSVIQTGVGTGPQNTSNAGAVSTKRHGRLPANRCRPPPGPADSA